jgi:5-formyltetrahydrofolate cyclo-ligase
MTVLPNDKATTRSRLINERITLGSETRADQSARACRVLLDAIADRGPRRVAAYVAVGVEPNTRTLIDGLSAAGCDVLLPVLLPDGDLDWARFTGHDRLAPGRLGILEPIGARLGVSAVLDCDVLVTPALAVDAHGVRLGRGGGSYDRVLRRTMAATTRPWSIALLFDGESGVPLPVEPHDRAVDAAATPSGLRHYGSDRRVGGDG